jgi:ribosomal protein S12 methylthiotransferase
MRFFLVSLGCPKNEVDADNMAQLLTEAGHSLVSNASEADLLVVNTCGFIDKAREESLAVLLELSGAKRPDQKLVAAGCFSQLYRERLLKMVPGLDGLLGTRRWMEIDHLADTLQAQPAFTGSIVLDDPTPEAVVRVRDRILRGRPTATAYLRIADGCDAACAFCTIPHIKGPLVSRPAAEVVAEACYLVQQGAKELVVIAQDTTAYGQDRGEQDALPGLLESILAKAPDLAWLRLMYAYPQHISPHLIELIAGHPRICHYLDLPLQHAHPATLRRMHRPHNVDHTQQLLARLRNAVPDITLRTTFIVGYPGETDEEFSGLLAFVQDNAFDHVGVFTYSPEDGTPAATLPDMVPEQIKQERYDRLMSLQQKVSLKRNRAQVGRTLDVLVEGTGEGLSLGRSYRDAPEIDGLIMFSGEAPLGDFVPVRITDAGEYDLGGKWLRRRQR